jgi:hypothetical protein
VLHCGDQRGYLADFGLSDAGEKVGTSPHRQDARSRRNCLTNPCCHMTGTIAKPMDSQPAIHGLIAEVQMAGLK